MKRRLTILSDSIAEHRGKLHFTGPGTVVIRGQKGDDWVCGECGAVLAEKAAGLPLMVNAAIKCNACTTYNDITRFWPHAKKPITVANLDKLPKPTEVFTTPSLINQCPHANKLNELSKNLLAEWSNDQGQRPQKLYHYTSSVGLRGIVGGGRLWATDLAYLNDSTELELALGLIRQVVDDVLPMCSDISRELLRRATGSESVFDRSHGYYIVCFCGDGDLLSQWRAYGAGGGGYAIGFAAHQFGAVPDVFVRRAIYDENIQRRLIHSVITQMCKLLDESAPGKTIADLDSDNTLPAFSSLLRSHLADFCFAFKHAAFSEEQEWRVVVPFSKHENLNSLEFRDWKGILIPYLNSDLGAITNGLPQLPIVEIMHGPTLHPQLTKKSLELLLERHNLGHVEIYGSEAPLRA